MQNNNLFAELLSSTSGQAWHKETSLNELTQMEITAKRKELKPKNPY